MSRRKLSHSDRSLPFSCSRCPAIDALETRRLFTTFVVTNLDNTGLGSLRTSIMRANQSVGADVITFAPGLTGTITLSSGQLELTDPAGLQVQGPGPSAITVTGGDKSRVFQIDAGTSASISGLTITHGHATDGAGNIIADGNLDLSNCVVSFGTNSSINRVGGGLDARGVTNLTDCQFLYNGMLQPNSTLVTSSAGAINAHGTMTILRSTFLGNGAQAQSGTIANSADLTIIDSTIADGRVGIAGGGITNSGSAELKVVGSTITGNEHGGIWNFGVVEGNSAPVIIENSTIGQNDIGLFNQRSSGSFLVLQSTITANTTGVDNAIGGSVSIGNSIVSGNSATDISGSYADLAGNYLGGNARLGPLKNNGGPTQTYLPGTSSPVLNIGVDANRADVGPDGVHGTSDDMPFAYDQRGVGFARVKGSAVDAGAIEGSGFNRLDVAIDPNDPRNTVLYVDGSRDADTILFARGSTSNSVAVVGNGEALGEFIFNGRIIVDGGDGADTISIDSALNRAAMIFGGVGADNLSGGSAADVIVGGDGADKITGGGGNDLLIGGADADQVFGGAGDDILIGGSSDYDAHTDANLKALAQLSDAWKATPLYLVNVVLLGLGIGPSHPYKLDAATVHDDGMADTLTGGAGQDWFLGNVVGRGTRDTFDRGLLEIALDV